MFTAPILGLLVGLSAAAWVFSKVGYRTGGNNKQALIAAGMAGLFSFVFVIIFVGFLEGFLGN